jgi:hypothetical protein
VTVEFIVDVPATRLEERDYALSVLLREWLGVTYSMRILEGIRETTFRLRSSGGDGAVTFPDVLLSAGASWLKPESLPSNPLSVLRPPPWSDVDIDLPLIYSAETGGSELIQERGNRLAARLDLLGSIVFLTTGYEEHVAPERRDRFDRYPASASSLGASGWLEWPILDIYLHLFAGLVRRVWPRLEITLERGRVAASHDVDHPSSAGLWHGIARLRKVSADLIRRRDPSLAMRRISAFWPFAGRLPPHDPFNTFAFLMDVSESVGLSSTFFFLAKDSEVPSGSRYSLEDPWVAPLMDEIVGRGHHIGLHGSYDSSMDAERLEEELRILTNATRRLRPGAVRRSIRQHYLRQRAGTTWRAQAAAGLEEDESFGFADASGYRAGTARSFPAFDIESHRQLPLRVKPLHVMDTTLTEYNHQPLDVSGERVLAMGRRTRQYGGTFSVLWHNSNLETRRRRQFYRALLTELSR